MKKVSVLFATNSPLARGVAGGTRRGVAKKFIITIMCVVGITTAYAETSEITTSQHYVDTNAATKQDVVPANNANTVMTYDSTADSGIGTKAIYNESSIYETQKNALVSAATANAAIQNGINSEFTCANPPKCNLWNMAGLFPTSLPAGYTELEYIEGTGTQWIDLGMPIGSVENITVKFAYTDDTAFWWFGARDGDGDYTAPGFSITFSGSKGQTIAFMAVNDNGGSVGQVYSTAKLTLNQPYTLNWHGKPSFIFPTITPNLALYNSGITQSSYAYTPTRNAYLFNIHTYTSSVSRRGRPMRVYSFVVEGKINLVPVRRDSDNVVGMYDIVRGVFLPNSSPSGDNFIAGPVASYIPQNQ